MKDAAEGRVASAALNTPRTRSEREKRSRVELFLVFRRRIYAGAMRAGAMRAGAMRAGAMRTPAGAALVAAVLIVATGCARSRVPRASTPPAPASAGATEAGIASWYGAPYDGRASASGEIYDMEQLTAAHRTLPFGTWVEVSNLDNGRSVKVRINDRGPFVEGRVIDLSHAAARAIDMLGPGTARVKVKVIALPAATPGEPPGLEGYAVQAGAFSNHERAESLRASLGRRFSEARVVDAPPLWRVLVGHGLTLEAANHLAAEVRGAAGQAIVVRDR